MPELCEDIVAAYGLSGFARRLRDGELTAESATQAYLDRIATIDPKLGAYVSVDPEGALARARQIDGMVLRGEDLGPLMGIPIAVKEIFRVEGFPFGAGTRLEIEDLTPDEGPFVRALRDQGAIVLGTTRTTEFATATINCETASAWNPWDAGTKRLCGGSSNGSAAALAAGLCALSIGSDTGGSVRLPAALCGVVGFKPSLRVWPTEGVFPLSPTFDSVGLFSSTVGDAMIAFSALTGQQSAAPAPTGEVRLARVVNLFEGLDERVACAMDRALAKLKAARVQVEDIELPEVEDVAPVFARILPLELISYLGRTRLEAGRVKLDPLTWARIEGELHSDEVELPGLRRRAADVARSVQAKVASFDALIAPTTPLSPEPVDMYRSLPAAMEWNRSSGRNTRPGNYFGLCGISIPIQGPGELPVGLQLLGRPNDDRHLLAVAEMVESVVGGRASPDLTRFSTGMRGNRND